jgi:uncharacterized membrane protein
MDRRHWVTGSALSTALGLVLLASGLPVQAQDMSKAPQASKPEKCYGINASAKNDCAAGAHSCAGQATQARDTKSFVLLPAGDCSKIQGGQLKAS